MTPEDEANERANVAELRGWLRDRVEDLIAHVGCGDLDAMGQCERCKAIRAALAPLLRAAALAAPPPDETRAGSDVLDGPRPITALDREYTKALFLIHQQREEIERLKAAQAPPPDQPGHTCHVSGDTCAGCDYALERDTRIAAARQAEAEAIRALAEYRAQAPPPDPPGRPPGLTKHQREAADMLRAVLAKYNLLDPIHGLDRDVDEAVRWALGGLCEPTPTAARQSAPLGLVAQLVEWKARLRELNLAISARNASIDPGGRPSDEADERAIAAIRDEQEARIAVLAYPISAPESP